MTYVLPPRPLGLGGRLRTGLDRLDAASVRAAATALGLGPAGTKAAALDLLERHHGDPAAVAAALAAAPQEARRLLDALDAGSGLLHDPSANLYGRRPPLPDPALRWLVERAILVPSEWGVFQVPREVTQSLRGGRLVRRLEPERPTVTGSTPPPAQDVDRMAAGAAVRLLDAVTALADLVDATPLARLRTAGSAYASCAVSAPRWSATRPA